MTDSSLPFPDGIGQEHTRWRHGFRRANPLAALILVLIVGAALAGLFGGTPSDPKTLDTPAARLTVTTPRVMRNGIFFETRIGIAAKAPLTDATLAITPSLWHSLTINSMIPQASQEAFKAGSFRFHYGKLAPGETLAMKVDGQVNPALFGGTSGSVALFDGDRELGVMPLTIKVWP
ncbi:MAG: hypothetical protein ACTHMG_13940 [Sphingomonas sp.]